MADQFSRMYDVERVGGDQRTRLAEMLRAAGQNQPQGQMVSGWYVAPSWSQNLNTALSGALGTYLGAKLDDEQKQKVADFLKKYEQGAEVKQEPVMQNFNRIEGVAEGQTPFPNQPAQTELQRAMGRQPIPVEGQTPAAQAMIERQSQPQYRPWSREEKENMLMEAYQIDPRMAGVLGARYDRDVAREEARALREQQQAFQASENEKNRQARAENIALMASLRPSPAEKPLTEYQGQSVLYGTRAATSNKVLENVSADPAATAAVHKGGIIANWMAPANVQQRVQAERDFLNAVLRRESGAVISPSEFDMGNKQYFPQPGDSPQVLAQKKTNRDLFIKGMARSAGPSGGQDVMAAITLHTLFQQSSNKLLQKDVWALNLQRHLIRKLSSWALKNKKG